MPNTILLNNKIYHFKEDELPCLITYKEKTGGSQFTVSMIADLFLQGSKILFFTAYPMAKENFLEQINGSESKTAYITNVEQLNTNIQAIILESGNEKLFLEAVKELPDITERVILVKNIEAFNQDVLDSCVPLSKVILSGNIDTCTAKKQIVNKKYNTTIIFSPPETILPVTTPPLEKYMGYFSSNNKTGLIGLKLNN